MKTKLSEELGLKYPIFGFTPSPKVAAAISRAGGMGVLGCIRYTDIEEMKRDVAWLDDAVEGKPYGLDIVMPQKLAADADPAKLEDYIDDRHRGFVSDLMARFDVPDLPADKKDDVVGITGWMHSFAREQLEIVFKYPVKLLANALGAPPVDIIERAHDQRIHVAALGGKPKHVKRHVESGVDIIVAQGHEAGGHCGEVTTMILVPEAVKAAKGRPVLAAGGIGTGQQVAAALALGADGVWLGSVWLTAEEYKLEPRGEGGKTSVVQDKLLAATSSDTVRSRVISGKPARMLKTAWTEAWTADDSPGTLPMPLQGILVAEAEARIRHHQHKELLGVPVGQIVGQMNQIETVQTIVERLVDGFEEARVRLAAL